MNPNNACQECEPADTASQWTLLADGVACGGGVGVCISGTCTAGVCFIGGIEYSAGEINPAGECQKCDPTNSDTGWTNLDIDCSSNGGNVCVDGTCQSGCYFIGYDGCSYFDGGILYPPGTQNPCTACVACQVNCQNGDCYSGWYWQDYGTPCGNGATCEMITPYEDDAGSEISEGCVP